MTEREKFLERWSRKKREVVEQPVQAKSEESDEKSEATPPVTEAGKVLDLEKLPSLESITAETDIRDFLQPGVPVNLKREALRRAWTTDPAIRDFIGLAENSGDFNDPTSMAGFGPIEPSEVARLMAQFVLTPPEEKKVAKAREPLTDQGDGPAEGNSSPASAETASEPMTENEGDAPTNAAARNEADPNSTSG